MSLLTGGLDEVGWGSIAGPIISVVAVFRREDLTLLPPGVKDSKQTTETQRQQLFLPLCSAAYDVGIGHAWPWEIDQYGPYPSLQLSYARALRDLHPDRKPDLLYVDGKNRIHDWKGQQIVEPKADVKYREVSAASMIAKHFRDTIMVDYAKQFPQYDWASNKGYGSESHLEAIRKHGLLIDGRPGGHYIHRQRYCTKLVKGAR